MRLEQLRHLGVRHHCPLCGTRLRAFTTEGHCPVCGSRPDERLLWLLLKARLRMGGIESVLQVAPEPALTRPIERAIADYTAADAKPGALAGMPSGRFDLVVCCDSPGDVAELHRVLKPGHLALLHAPGDAGDLEAHLEAAGFTVNRIDASSLGTTAFRRYGLHPGQAGPSNELYWCESAARAADSS